MDWRWETRGWQLHSQGQMTPHKCTKENVESEHKRLRTKQKMFKSWGEKNKERGRKQPIREVLQKSGRNTSKLKRSAASNLTNGWNRVRIKKKQLDLTINRPLLSSRRVSKEERINKRPRRLEDGMRREKGEFKKDQHKFAPGRHCLVLLQKISHLLMLLHPQVPRTQSKKCGPVYTGPSPGVWWMTLVLSLCKNQCGLESKLLQACTNPDPWISVSAMPCLWG